MTDPNRNSMELISQYVILKDQSNTGHLWSQEADMCCIYPWTGMFQRWFFTFRAKTDILDNSLGLFHNLQENASKKLANVYLPLESRAVTAWMVQCNKETEKVS